MASGGERHPRPAPFQPEHRVEYAGVRWRMCGCRAPGRSGNHARTRGAPCERRAEFVGGHARRGTAPNHNGVSEGADGRPFISAEVVGSGSAGTRGECRPGCQQKWRAPGRRAPRLIVRGGKTPRMDGVEQDLLSSRARESTCNCKTGARRALRAMSPCGQASDRSGRRTGVTGRVRGLQPGTPPPATKHSRRSGATGQSPGRLDPNVAETAPRPNHDRAGVEISSHGFVRREILWGRNGPIGLQRAHHSPGRTGHDHAVRGRAPATGAPAWAGTQREDPCSDRRRPGRPAGTYRDESKGGARLGGGRGMAGCACGLTAARPGMAAVAKAMAAATR